MERLASPHRGAAAGTAAAAASRVLPLSLAAVSGAFAGFAPAADPYLVSYVVIDEPTAGPTYYGSIWAAPLFAEIAERSLRYLNVTPDKIPTVPAIAIKNSPQLPGPTASKAGSNDTIPVRL